MSEVRVTQSCLTLCDPIDYSVHGILQLPFPSPGYLPNPGIKPRSPTLQMDSVPAEPQGKPKNTGMGSLSLLQGIFLTQALMAESEKELKCCLMRVKEETKIAGLNTTSKN